MAPSSDHNIWGTHSLQKLGRSTENQQLTASWLAQPPEGWSCALKPGAAQRNVSEGSPSHRLRRIEQDWDPQKRRAENKDVSRESQARRAPPPAAPESTRL